MSDTTKKIATAYRHRLIYNDPAPQGREDLEDLLHSVLEDVLTDHTEEQRADLYARLCEGGRFFECYGVERDIFITTTVRDWKGNLIAGGELRTVELPE